MRCDLRSLGFLLVPLLSLAADRNGIDVGHAKIYDNRSLTLMLDTLGDQLRQVQVVNQPALTAALGLLQGYQTQEVIRAGSFQAAIPYTQPAAPPPTGAPQTSGGTTTAGPAQVIPALAGVPWDMNTQFSGLTPSADTKYGLSAGDLLSDQVSLTYQIFNIRMLLDRSLTDRLQGHEAKLQAVLGFNVTLDPPRDAVGSAAIVEVTVHRKDVARGVSVVSLLPQERTYNSAALSTKTNAFGGSAAAKLITVGYSERRRGQTYYLFRDNDTVAFEAMTHVCEPVKFGWQFRPVLGRQSVAPGLRQMFAILSLDDIDPASDEGEAELEIQVETHWRKYDRGSLTTAEKSQIPWWNKLGYVAGLGIPFTYAPQARNEDAYNVSVPKTSRYQNDLRPKVKDVSWTWVGKKEMLLTIAGENFFRDTKVAVGGKIVDSPPALTIKSDQAIDLLVDAANVTDAAIVGRYGPAIVLREKPQGWQLSIQDVNIGKSIGGERWMDVTLGKNCTAPAGTITSMQCEPLTIEDLPSASPESMRLKLRGDGQCADLQQLKTASNRQATAFPLTPVVALNGNPIPGPWMLSNIGNKSKPAEQRVLARALVSNEVIKEPDGLVTITYPFKGPELAASLTTNDPNKIFEAVRVHDDPKSSVVMLVAKAPEARGWQTKDVRSRVLLSNGQEAELKPCDTRVPGSASSATQQQSEQNTAQIQRTTRRGAPRGRNNAQQQGVRTSAQTASAQVRAAAVAVDLFCSESADIAVLRTANLPNGDTLVLRQLTADGKSAGTYTIALPKKKDAKPAEKPLPTVNQYDSRWVALDTEGFKDFETAEIDGRALDSKRELIKETKDEKISKLEVYLSRAITAKPGTVEITFRDPKGAPVNRSKIEVKCVECQGKEPNKP